MDKSKIFYDVITAIKVEYLLGNIDEKVYKRLFDKVSKIVLEGKEVN